jgi:protein-S-isoprenylcysteine O-methyltransferase Ste14
MNPPYVRVIVPLANIIIWVMRGTLKFRAIRVPVVRRYFFRPREVVALVLGSIGLLLPLVWLATSALAFADYSTPAVAAAAGTFCYGWGLWLHHITNRDLGTHWSASLELKENHHLVTEGIYRQIRHPMYLSLLIFSVGQALALPNYVAGPVSLIAMILFVVFRLGPEERMLLNEFGDEYEVYLNGSNRLIPGIW